MSTDLTSNLSFEEKLKENIKNNIGDLISDEDLKRIVTSGIHNAFFGRLNSSDPSAPIHQMIREVYKEKIQELLQIWMAENSEKVEEIMKTYFNNNASGIVLDAFSKLMQPSFDQFTNNVSQSLHRINNRY